MSSVMNYNITNHLNINPMIQQEMHKYVAEKYNEKIL